MNENLNPPLQTDQNKLTERVTTYLNRHINWLKDTLADLENFDAELSDQELDTNLQNHQQRESQTQHFLREHHALLREWQASQNIDPNHLATVQQLAAQAETLTERLRKRYEQAVDTLQKGAANNNDSLRATRQGRDLLSKYRPGGDRLSGFIDKKA